MDLFAQDQHKWLVRIIIASAVAHILILIFAVSHNLNTFSRMIIYGGYLQLIQMYIATALAAKETIMNSNILKIMVGAVGLPGAFLSLIFVAITDRNGPEDNQGSALITLALVLAAFSWITLFVVSRMVRNKAEPPTAAQESQPAPESQPVPPTAPTTGTTIVIQQPPPPQTPQDPVTPTSAAAPASASTSTPAAAAAPASASTTKYAAPSRSTTTSSGPSDIGYAATSSWLDMLLSFT